MEQWWWWLRRNPLEEAQHSTAVIGIPSRNSSRISEKGYLRGRGPVCQIHFPDLVTIIPLQMSLTLSLFALIVCLLGETRKCLTLSEPYFSEKFVNVFNGQAHTGYTSLISGQLLLVDFKWH